MFKRTAYQRSHNYPQVDDCRFRRKTHVGTTALLQVMLQPGVSIDDLPYYFAFLDRMFWTSGSFDSSGIGRFTAFTKQFPIDSPIGIGLRTLVAAIIVGNDGEEEYRLVSRRRCRVRRRMHRHARKHGDLSRQRDQCVDVAAFAYER